MCNLLVVPIQKISPLPKGSKRYQTQRTKGAQKAMLLTVSPYKKQLEASKQFQAQKNNTNAGKIVKNVFSTTQINKRKKNFKSEEVEPRAGPSGLQKSKKNLKIIVNKNEWYCFLCCEANIEDMVLCQKCSRWAHESCAGFSGETFKRSFVCDLCLS